MSRAHGRRVPLVLFFVALIVRLGWVLLVGRHALAYSDDAKADHDLAVNLVERHQFVTAIDPPHRLDVPYATRPPLTPFALASVYLIFGPHLLAGQLFLACVGALSVVALHLLDADSETKLMLTVRNILNSHDYEPAFGGFDIPLLGRWWLLETRCCA